MYRRFGTRRLRQGRQSNRGNIRLAGHIRDLYLPAIVRRSPTGSARAAQASGVQDQKATNDTVAMGVGLIIFWPALLFTKGNDENTAELARLKGQMEAIEEASFSKRCGITFQRAPAPQ